MRGRRHRTEVAVGDREGEEEEEEEEEARRSVTA